MAASLTLRVPAGVPLTNAQVDNNFSQLNAFGNTINSNVGILSNLTTTATGNLVVAINEIRATSATVTVTDDTTTNTTHYVVISASTSGNVAVKVSSTKLLFNPSTGLLTSTDYNSSSDISLKENFVPISNSLDIIDQLKGFGFNWKDSKEKSYGLSAQDVEKVLPEIVKNRPDGTKGINYLNIIAFLVEAVKDLKQEVLQLKKYK